MKIQQYYSAIIRHGSRSVPTYSEVRRNLAMNSLDPRYFGYL